MRWKALCLLAISLSATQSFADSSHRFEDSPAKPIAPKALKYVLGGANDQIRAKFEFVRKGVQKPNFGGHYVFSSYGCGTGCTASGIVDLNTGVVYRAPFNEELSNDALEQFGVKEAYRADSNVFFFSNYRYIKPNSPDMSQENGVAVWNEAKKQFEIVEKRKPYKIEFE